MKKNVVIVLTIAAIIISVYLIVWVTPRHFLKGIKAQDIHVISVRDGSNGNNFDITSQEDIIFIAGKIQSQPYRKDGISMFLMGTLYTMRFYDSDSRLVEEFILNADDRIRKDPFFYITDPELSGLTDYIRNISEKHSGK